MPLERWLYTLRLRLRSLVRRNRVEDDLADEMQFHIEERARELRAQGPERARGARCGAARVRRPRAAKRRVPRRAPRRLARGPGPDLRYGARMLRAHAGLHLVAVLSLSLGIGANTAIFTLFDAVLLKPLPVDRPEELRTTNMVVRINGLRHQVHRHGVVSLLPRAEVGVPASSRT